QAIGAKREVAILTADQDDAFGAHAGGAGVLELQSAGDAAGVGFAAPMRVEVRVGRETRHERLRPGFNVVELHLDFVRPRIAGDDLADDAEVVGDGDVV